MAYTAYTALGTWRKEKKHEILLEAFAFRREAKAYLEIIRNPIGVSSHLHRETYEKRKAEKQEVFDKIQQILEKLNYTIDDADPLLLYYRYICEVDMKFNVKVGMLDFYSREIEEQKTDYVANSDYETDFNQLYDRLYEVRWSANENNVPNDRVLKRLHELEQKILLDRKSHK